MNWMRYFLLTGAVHTNDSISEAGDELSDTSKENKLMIRLIISLIFSLPLLFISIGHFLGIQLPGFIDPAKYPFNFELVRIILTIPVIIVGWRIYFEGFRSLLTLQSDFYALPAIATAAAFGFGVYAVIQLGEFSFKYTPNLYFETGAVILTLVTLEKFLESLIYRKALSSSGLLYAALPKQAFIVRDNIEYKIPVKEIQRDDIIAVHSGDIIPADGIIVSGTTIINESGLTGDLTNREYGPEQKVWAYSRNMTHTIHIRVEAPPASCFHTQMIDSLRKAPNIPSQTADTAKTIAGWFVPIVIILGIIASFTWYLTGKSVSFALNIFTAVLTAACPCCMLHVIRTLVATAVGRGIRSGFMITSGNVLEKITDMNTVIFSDIFNVDDIEKASTELSREGIYSMRISSDIAAETPVTDGDRENAIHVVSKNTIQDIIIQTHAVGNVTGNVALSDTDTNLFSKADIRILADKSEHLLSDTADILLINTHLITLTKAVALSREYCRKMKRSVLVFILFNLILIPVAMGVLSLFNGPLLNPMIGAFIMIVFSLVITANTLRLPHFNK